MSFKVYPISPQSYQILSPFSKTPATILSPLIPNILYLLDYLTKDFTLSMSAYSYSPTHSCLTSSLKISLNLLISRSPMSSVTGSNDLFGDQSLLCFPGCSPWHYYLTHLEMFSVQEFSDLTIALNSSFTSIYSLCICIVRSSLPSHCFSMGQGFFSFYTQFPSVSWSWLPSIEGFSNTLFLM